MQRTRGAASCMQQQHPTPAIIMEEVDTVQSICHISNNPNSMLCAILGPQGWEELPVELLHSIIVKLGSARDLLAFTATCPSWHAAFTSIRSTLGALFPPLIFRICADQTSTSDSTSRHTWELIDLSYPTTPLRRLCPSSILDTMTPVECSYGHAIFSFGRSHVIVDMFTGTTVVAPPFPLNQMCYRAFIVIHASPDAYLFISGPQCLFAWRVGSPSWLHCDDINAHMIQQIVTFKGRVFAKMHCKLYAVHLEPELHIEALKVFHSEDIGPSKVCGKLVACDDMIAMLDIEWEAFFLDMSVEPIEYVRMEDECLEKRAFFLCKKGSGQPRHTMNPERMGLRGCQIYWLDRKAQVYSVPAVDRKRWRFREEPNLAALNAYISRNPATFTAWV